MLTGLARALRLGDTERDHLHTPRPEPRPPRLPRAARDGRRLYGVSDTDGYGCRRVVGTRRIGVPG
ncbi:hypothetical protein VT50_0201435 [Streptomyces antioxidans]|uniref:Uncharacterized protein n=1 Tax=Streptomyces antioxidans TaxID=1507734 RepID=A0A1V4DDD0_9ACTN|nr:hypothetical protein [Streptomyces antioxidans]OPF84705.1 hypothetical protein VT50_0201435 [Streptomyces antioxidans]